MNQAAAIEPSLANVAEFLNWIETQDGKFEFENYRLVAMTGGSVRHGALNANLTASLIRELGESSCLAVTGTAAIIDDGTAYYPDIMVSCTQ